MMGNLNKSLNKPKQLKSMDPNMFAIFYFVIIFFERSFYFKKFFYCSPNFYLFSIAHTSPRWNYMNMNKGAFRNVLTVNLERWYVPPLLVVHFFFIEAWWGHPYHWYNHAYYTARTNYSSMSTTMITNKWEAWGNEGSNQRIRLQIRTACSDLHELTTSTGHNSLLRILLEAHEHFIEST
jgi:hypothetical protein